MGLSIFSSADYITWPEFAIFVDNARRYLEINACVWAPAQQSVLISFFDELIKTLENRDSLDYPWGSPGAGWAASGELQRYFTAVRNAVPKSHKFSQTYPYTVGASGDPTVPIPAFPLSQGLGRLFLLVAFFYGAYLDKDTAQDFLSKVDYPSYVFVTPPTTGVNVDYAAMAAFITGMSQIHFCGKEVTLPPNRLLILQDPAFLLTGRVIQFPQSRSDKCCEVVALHCLQRVNCGIYITKLVRDIFCDVTCRDPCRKCNVTLRQGCYADGTAAGDRTENPFTSGSSEIEAYRAENIPEREYRERFITIRPFINSDLLVPQIFNRIGNTDNNWVLGLPDEFLTSADINARDNLDRHGALGWNPETEPGRDPNRTTAWVPFRCGCGTTGCAGGCAGGSGYEDDEYDAGYVKGGDERGSSSKYFRRSPEKGFRSFRVQSELDPLVGPDVLEEDFVGGRRPGRERCRRRQGPCVCAVPCFEPPKLAIPVQRIRRIRPITVFGLLIYLVEKLDWTSRVIERIRLRTGA